MTDPVQNDPLDRSHANPSKASFGTAHDNSYPAHDCMQGPTGDCRQLPRKLANEVNPLVSAECTEETLGRIADMLDVYGSLLAGFNGNSAMYYCTETMFDPLAAALRYEVLNCRLQCEGLRQVVEEAGWRGRGRE